MDSFTKGGRKLRKAVVAGIAVVSVIAVIAILFVIQRTTTPVFSLVNHNWDLDTDWTEEFEPIYTVTIYIRIKNEGIDGSNTVVCEVTREDLTKTKKSQSVFIKGGQEKTINFVFSHSELKGTIPKEYKAWID